MISAAIPHDLLGAPEHATSSRRPWRREPPRSSPRHLPPFTVVTGRRGRSPAGDTQPRGAGAAGVPYSAATARIRLCNGEVPQRLCGAPSSRPRPQVPTLVLARWVACPCGWSGRPSPSWSPLFGGRQTAALLVWTFCGAQRLGKAATWRSQVVFLPAGTKGHVP